MHSLLKKFYGVGVIPVLKHQNHTSSEKIIETLLGQSLYVLEIALHSSGTFDLVKELKQKYPNMIIGLSNVLLEEQVEAAVESGADYLSSVNVNEALIGLCREKGILIIPECATAMELEHAKNLNLECVKLLAGTPLADIQMIPKLYERYQGMKFILSPGIKVDDFVEYLDKDYVVACCLDGLVKEKNMDNFDYDQAGQELGKLINNLLGLELAHVGINGTPKNYKEIAQEYGSLLNCSLKELPGLSFFAGTTIEVMRENGRGEHGHIAYRVNNVERAMQYYESRGYRFIEDTFKTNENGKIIFAYFEKEIGGFAIHLTQK